jgi:hypothetical protein
VFAIYLFLFAFFLMEENAKQRLEKQEEMLEALTEDFIYSWKLRCVVFPAVSLWRSN